LVIGDWVRLGFYPPKLRRRRGWTGGKVRQFDGSGLKLLPEIQNMNIIYRQLSGIGEQN